MLNLNTVPIYQYSWCYLTRSPRKHNWKKFPNLQQQEIMCVWITFWDKLNRTLYSDALLDTQESGWGGGGLNSKTKDGS